MSSQEDENLIKSGKSQISNSNESRAVESSSTRWETICSQLFHWSPERVRKTDEYVEKKYEKPFNQVAPELRVIGGLGRKLCTTKKKHQPLINRPTQVQKICHTTTKPLPNFSLTERLCPTTCRKKRQLTFLEAAEEVKLAENLPLPSTHQTLKLEETQNSFNCENIFNLDLSTLSEYQKQKYNAEENERRRNYQIIRRTMETKALQTVGVERIKQEERNEKFQLPKFFNVDDEAKVEKDLDNGKFNNNCKFVSTIDKPRNREIQNLHFQHKEEKLRERIREQDMAIKFLTEEKKKLEQAEAENLAFHLADESFTTSECQYNERLTTGLEQLDYSLNESELNGKSLSTLDENSHSDDVRVDIPCGERQGSRVILRSFHDRISKEPRGETNYHELEQVGTGKSAFRSHKDWLNAMANDPDILREPPRGKLLSTVKFEQEPNDDKTFLFDDLQHPKTNVVSPIRLHIEQLDLKLKARLKEQHVKKSKSHINIANQKSYKRMNFMGIPVAQSSQMQTKDLQVIVEKASTEASSRISYDKRKNSSPQEIKLIPKIPEFDYIMNENREHSRIDNIVPFSKAQPRGTNAKNLRVDKSLPWIQDELIATKTRRELERDTVKSFSSETFEAEAEMKPKRKVEETLSSLKLLFRKKIAEKLKLHKPETAEENKEEFKVEERQSNDDASSSCLSSVGTYFTNDSGSFLMELEKKIPKSEMNLQKKFQNRSLVTVKQVDDVLPPFTIPTVAQFGLMKQLQKPKDKFHTFRTRSNANIRERNLIRSLSYEEEIFRAKKFKDVSKLVTDIDEFYRNEFYHLRTRTNFRFKPRTEAVKLREAFQMKMDVAWMKEKLILDQDDAARLEEVLRKTLQEMKETESFLNTSKEENYYKSVKVMKKAKTLYQDTSLLAKQLDERQGELETMKMKIFLIGFNFVRLVILQKFQFILKPLDWRLEFDHLHLNSEGKLQDIVESINTRNTTNFWDQENVTAFTVKDFILNVYVKRPKPIVLFENVEQIFTAISDLQSKSYRLLGKFHFVAHSFAETENDFMKINKSIKRTLEKDVESSKNLGQRQIFLVSRSKEIESLARNYISKPLDDSFGSKQLRMIRGECEVIFKDVVIKNSDSSITKYFTSIDKLADVERKVLNILEKLDKIPKTVIDKVEKTVRLQRKKKLLVAERAQTIEENLQMRITQLRRCMQKPPKKEKRVGKLPMSKLPKKLEKVKIQKPFVSPMEEEYIRAFTSLGVGKEEIKFDKNAKMMMERMKNANIPFYVDKLLENLGFNPPSNSKDNTEEIILDEMKNFKYKNVIPEVRRRFDLWLEKSEAEKKQNIDKTEYLYK